MLKKHIYAKAGEHEAWPGSPPGIKQGGKGKSGDRTAGWLQGPCSLMFDESNLAELGLNLSELRTNRGQREIINVRLIPHSTKFVLVKGNGVTCRASSASGGLTRRWRCNNSTQKIQTVWKIMRQMSFVWKWSWWNCSEAFWACSRIKWVNVSANIAPDETRIPLALMSSTNESVLGCWSHTWWRSGCRSSSAAAGGLFKSSCQPEGAADAPARVFDSLFLWEFRCHSSACNHLRLLVGSRLTSLRSRG